ncbi:MAG: HypC/HybG/HupF family hydrogenase formation chaperone [Desulfovibrio sp.]|nr:HypC/HybG/HupF family hydrogenase formation chaperone [Desulfovibrio sp.]
MCLAVPAKVEEIFEDGTARCRVGEGDAFVTASLALLEEPPQPGDYLIIHAGFALRKLDAADAEETIALLREMIAVVDAEHANCAEPH